MNLLELRQSIEAELQYGPDVQSHKDELSRVINDEYGRLCSEHPWLFLQKTATLNVFGSDGEFSGTVPNGTGYWLTLDTVTPHADWVGMPCSWTDTQARTATIMDVNPTLGGILVDAVGNTTSSFTDFTVTFPKYLLPEDLTDILSLMSRGDDRGVLTHIDLDAESEFQMNTDITGDPNVYMFAPQEKTAAPRAAPTLAAGVGTGTLSAGDHYYCYTWVHYGRESARSPIAKITLATSGDVDLSAMETDDSSTASNHFTTRRLYRKDGSTGVWKKVADVDGSSATYTDDTPDANLANDVRVYEDRGPQQYVRVWPLPASTVSTSNTAATAPTELELRYRYRPRRLQHDTDTPDLPPEHHQVLVNLVVERLARRHGNKDLAGHHGKMVREEVKRMRARYLVRSATTYQRRLSTFSRRFAGAPLTITKS